MSKLLSFTASGNIGPTSGMRLGSVTLSAGSAAATAVFTDGGVTILQLTAPIGSSVPHTFADDENGVFINGQLAVTLTGAGAAINVEEL